VLLADEPVSNLDPDLTFRVLEILRQQTRRESRTVLCVLHDQSLVRQFADIVISLNSTEPERWTVRALDGDHANGAGE
jgi:ABC-type phosphate/phosphonate transport system ATPase subunit